MILLIVTIILTIILFLALGIKYDRGEDTISWGIKGRCFLSVFCMALCLFGCFTKIPTNSVGILYSPFGGTKEETLSEGFHGKNIFDKVFKISTEVQTMTVENLTTQTMDAQFLNSTLDIKYKVSPENAYLIFKQFRTLENMSMNLIVPTTQRVLELITTKYNVIDILGEERSTIYAELETELPKEFSKYGVEFYSISIIDMDAGEALEKAIADEAVAKKSVETAEQNLLKTQIEAKQQSVQAQAEQDAARIQAETKLIEAEAEKKANELLNQSLSDEILQIEWINKWDGKMPTYYGGGNGAGIIFDASTPDSSIITE